MMGIRSTPSTIQLEARGSRLLLAAAVKLALDIVVGLARAKVQSVASPTVNTTATRLAECRRDIGIESNGGDGSNEEDDGGELHFAGL
ncbi:hypothetical protein Landi51_09409 [Colletotrichum acutatum]